MRSAYLNKNTTLKLNKMSVTIPTTLEPTANFVVQKSKKAVRALVSGIIKPLGGENPLCAGFVTIYFLSSVIKNRPNGFRTCNRFAVLQLLQ